MMVAGILSQKTKRPIKALHGGLDGFWEETELKSAVRAVPLPGGSPKLQAAPALTPAAPSAAPATPPAAPAAPKKKSAGC